MKSQLTLFTFVFLFLVHGSLTFGQLEVLYTPNLTPTIDGVIDENDPWQEDGMDCTESGVLDICI